MKDKETPIKTNFHGVFNSNTQYNTQSTHELNSEQLNMG